MTLRLSDQIHIDRPQEAVWPHVSRLDNELRWRRPYVVDLSADGDPLTPGSRISGTTRAFGQTDTYVNEVTDVVPPRRLAWRGLEASGSLIGAVGSYELEPQGTGTRFRLAIDYAPQGPGGRLQAPLLGIVLRWILHRFMRQLKSEVESRGQSARISS
jgi:uncharacterized membrane protein